MEIFDKSYVGINLNREDITTAPLAFLTPYEDNAAGRKRQESVNQWAHGGYWRDRDDREKPQFKTVANKWREGFRVVGFAVRDTTDNKMARVYDPEGYELEISVNNLVSLMQHCIIDQGEIQGKCIWAREGANNWLVQEDTPEAKSAIKAGEKLEVQIGDVVVGPHKRHYVYLGRKAVQQVAVYGELVEVKADRGSWAYGPRVVYKMKPEKVTTETVTGPLPHVYYCIKGDTWTVDKIETRVKPMKISANLGPTVFEYNENSVFKKDRGSMLNEQGEFVEGARYDGPIANWYTNSWLVRDEAFTSDDVDLDAVVDGVFEENINIK